MGDLGRYLTAGRERAGLTAEQVAKITRIPLRFVEALEAERLEELPGPVYVRGFVRSYCRAAGLDEGPAREMIAALPRVAGEREARKAAASGPATDLLVGERRGSSMNWAYLVIALVFVVGILVALLTVGTGGPRGDVSRVKGSRGADWTEQLPPPSR